MTQTVLVINAQKFGWNKFGGHKQHSYTCHGFVYYKQHAWPQLIAPFDSTKSHLQPIITGQPGQNPSAYIVVSLQLPKVYRRIKPFIMPLIHPIISLFLHIFAVAKEL